MTSANQLSGIVGRRVMWWLAVACVGFAAAALRAPYIADDPWRRLPDAAHVSMWCVCGLMLAVAAIRGCCRTIACTAMALMCASHAATSTAIATLTWDSIEALLVALCIYGSLAGVAVTIAGAAREEQ